MPTILVTGVVPRLDRLRRLGRVKRAEWTAVVRESAGPGVALAILGSAPAHVDTHAVMAALRREAATATVPLLHLAGHDAACEGCGADVCLPALTRPETLLGVTRTLLTLRRGTWQAAAPASTLREAARVAPDARGSGAARPARSSAGLEEVARRDAASLLLRLVEVVPGVVYLYDLGGRKLVHVSPAVEAQLGYTPAALLALDPEATADLVHPEDRARIVAAFGAAQNGAPAELELRVRATDGRWRTLRTRAVALRPGDDLPGRVLGVATDVTEEHETRRMLERAQRLEALGQLAGGIAHDFNNILGVITGHGQLAQQLLPRDHPASVGIEQVVKASERAAALTHQLLSLSRTPRRGPHLLDLNAVVDGVAAMLQRVISEDVEFDVRPGAALGSVRADPGEIEQILLNLALNARDAMPMGGRLGIETRNAKLADEEATFVGLAPGPYVVLAVSDSGTGMDAQTRERIFEPFFTTKPEGRGSGLGLATVHGIVERCGGAIRVDSTPGVGTTFRIYLPREDSPATEHVLPAPAASGSLEGRETVLLVEDADSVRDVTRELLEGLGYTVLAAAHGAQALALARAFPGPIHLLLTDVVMPRLGGGTLAAEVASLRPRIRVVYMSGYTTDALPGHSAPGTLLLQKPFTRDRLAQAIREALDRTDA
jgi:two-component system, cell cycle sensor histidine kinase and response regulator CckA